MFHLFKNRAEAGSDLATALSKYAGKPDTLILALPRGGVPVACEAAKALSLPMDVWLVRKVGVPGHEELALGAIDLNGAFHVNPEVAVAISIPQSLINHLIEKERVELARRNKLYRQERPAPSLDGKTVIVIDDGLA
ncbi:MAG TPA: phosphoribosyltransferase family protein, partial [Micavibrio sp.]